ncbi:hypothetical protein [Candidatus Venteria ishoeyi]|uniref:Bacteriophage Lambda NinG protein n=1 Tax=Candidatus Venteria ishoeyi TaxID=1899563 RepID=A0A1H6F8S5_9GAMM|nr:hypothetical protein [Candidatus Venteria ishoeyi]SEH06500.1 Uncharacterised protein [Candidatus Venteria ishoeyi]
MAIKIKPADTWFSKCIRQASKWTCERCGSVHEPGSMGLHCSHVFSRRHRTIRWCKENAQALCFSCHQWYGGNPVDSGAWVENEIGEGVIMVLREKMNLRIRVSKLEEKEIARHYKQQYENLLAGATDFDSWQ